jgi:hypothetical protein
MAIRVTADEVREIMDGVTATDTIINTFITAASAVIDNIFANDSVIGDTLKKELERWLTAHLMAMSIARTASEEKLGEANVKYTGKWGENLLATPYGQTVLTLDITGKMSSIGKRAASMYSIPSFNEYN